MLISDGQRRSAPLSTRQFAKTVRRPSDHLASPVHRCACDTAAHELLPQLAGARPCYSHGRDPYDQSFWRQWQVGHHRDAAFPYPLMWRREATPAIGDFRCVRSMDSRFVGLLAAARIHLPHPLAPTSLAAPPSLSRLRLHQQLFGFRRRSRSCTALSGGARPGSFVGAGSSPSHQGRVESGNILISGRSGDRPAWSG